MEDASVQRADQGDEHPGLIACSCGSSAPANMHASFRVLLVPLNSRALYLRPPAYRAPLNSGRRSSESLMRQLAIALLEK